MAKKPIPPSVGERVGAFMSADKETIYLLGFGRYETDDRPPYVADVSFEQAEQMMRNAEGQFPEMFDTEEKRRRSYAEYRESAIYKAIHFRPKIVLDHEDVVWGGECHFFAEEFVRDLMAKRRVQRVVLQRKEDGSPWYEQMAGTA